MSFPAERWHLQKCWVSCWIRFEENHNRTITHVQKVREQEWVRMSWHMNPHRRRRHEMLYAHETLHTQWFRRKPAPSGMRPHDKLRKNIVKQSVFQTVKNHTRQGFRGAGIGLHDSENTQIMFVCFVCVLWQHRVFITVEIEYVCDFTLHLQVFRGS